MTSKNGVDEDTTEIVFANDTNIDNSNRSNRNNNNSNKHSEMDSNNNDNNNGQSPPPDYNDADGTENQDNKALNAGGGSDGRPKLIVTNSGDAEIKYNDEQPQFNIDVSSDLDSEAGDDDNDSKKQDSRNLTPNKVDTPNGGQTPQSGSRPFLKPSASQQERDAKDFLNPSPKHKRPELQPATTSSKKPILDIHDIRQFAKNFESANEVRDFSIEMEPNFTDNNDVLDEPPEVTGDDGGKQRLNSTSGNNLGGTPNNSRATTGGFSGTASNGDFKSADAVVDKLRNDKTLEEPVCVINDWLYLGTDKNAAHINQIKNLQITHILNCTDSIPNYFQNSKELSWTIDYARIPIPNREYSLIYDYFKAAVQFMDIVNPDEDTVQLEKEISRNDRRSARYDFDDGGMVVLAGGNNTNGNNDAAGASSGGLDVLREDKEVGNGDDSNLDDANDMEFAFDSENEGDYETPNENSKNERKDSERSNGNGTGNGNNNNKHGMQNSIELGQNVKNGSGEGPNMDNYKKKKNSSNKTSKSNNNTKNTLKNSPLSNNSMIDEDDNSSKNQEYRNKYKNMKRKILIHCSGNLSRSTTIVLAYLVAKQIRFNNEEKKQLNNCRIELLKQDPKLKDRIREKRAMESQNRYINELIYEMDRRELHLLFCYNEKTMKQLKKLLKKQEKLVQQQMEQLQQNNLSPKSASGSNGLTLVSQQSNYTDHLRIQQLKHQTDIYALGYVGGMSLAVAYFYLVNLNPKAVPNHGFCNQLAIWERKKRHGMATLNELPHIKDIRNSIFWVKEKERKPREHEAHLYSDEVDEGPIPPEPSNGPCSCAIL